uniref:Uncharacterized protein n=1 Tax=Anguilla anguilla TaxID=7936 RepID=A0A0E9X300_ANGAN
MTRRSELHLDLIKPPTKPRRTCIQMPPAGHHWKCPAGHCESRLQRWARRAVCLSGVHTDSWSYLLDQPQHFRHLAF